MCVCVCKCVCGGGGGGGGSPSPCAGPELAGSSSTVFAVNLIFYLRGWLRLLGAGERGAVCSLSHLSSSLAFIFTRSFLLRTAPHHLNAWNRLHGRLLWGKTWSRGTNSGVNVTHKKWWIKWHKIIWKNREIDHQNLREMQREEWKMKKTKSIFRPHACINCKKAKLSFPLNVVCTFPPLSRCLFFCMVFYWKAHFSKPLSAEDFNPIKRGTLNVCMGHRFYQGAKKLSKSWEVVRRDGHFAFKNILYGIFK